MADKVRDTAGGSAFWSAGGPGFSSKTEMWATPSAFFAALDEEFAFEVDVCASPENAKCERYFTEADDGLTREWRGICWMNPPYGRDIGAWMKKAYESAQAGATVVCLVPARTDTGWWHEWAMRAAEIRLLQGRMKFGGAKTGAPFPSVVVIFRAGHSGAPHFSAARVEKGLRLVEASSSGQIPRTRDAFSTIDVCRGATRPNVTSEFWTSQQVADLLQVSLRQVSRLAARDGLPHADFGGVRRYPADQVERWAGQRVQTVRQERAPRQTKAAAPRRPRGSRQTVGSYAPRPGVGKKNWAA